MYKRLGIKPVLDCANAEGKVDKKRVLFLEKFQKVEDLPEAVRTSLGEYLKDNEPYEVALKYENYDASMAPNPDTIDEALRELLPKEETVPTGYEIVGNILHFNLPAELFPYKGLIGQVYLNVRHSGTQG